MSNSTVNGDESSLSNKCLEICQALVQKGQTFSFSLKLKPFSFSLDIKESLLETRTVVKKNKMSPSTLRRNMRRKKEFLEQKKKESSDNNTDTNIDLEASSLVENSVKCNLCDKVCKSESGLKIHKGKAHKGSDPPAQAEKLRAGSGEVSPLKVSPVKEQPREEQCTCCGEIMGPQHQCTTETTTPKPKPKRNPVCDFCGKIFDGSAGSEHRTYNMHWDRCRREKAN